MFKLNRANNPARQPKIDNTGGVDPWADKAGPGQSLIAGKAVRTEGNPWGDSDGGKSQIGNMVSDAWKSGGY